MRTSDRALTAGPRRWKSRRVVFLSSLLVAGVLSNAGQSTAQYYQRDSPRGDFYNGVRNSGRDGDYYGRDHGYDRDYRPGGIGPGGGAAIGAAGGAALGAAFGGGLQGVVVGGAVGAGIGAVAGQAHQNHERRDYYYRGRPY